MQSGFIAIERRVFATSLWRAERTYSLFEAYVDLVQMARFGSGTTERMVGSKCVRVGRGEVAATQTFLAKRWGWSRTSVQRFIERGEKEQLFIYRIEQGVGVFTFPNGESTQQTMVHSSYEPLSEPLCGPPSGLPSGQPNAVILSELDGVCGPPSGQCGGLNNNKDTENKFTEKVVGRVALRPPSVEEVEQYCQREGLWSVDAARFVLYHEANGWRVGRNPMLSWKAVAQMWHQRELHGCELHGCEPHGQYFTNNEKTNFNYERKNECDGERKNEWFENSRSGRATVPHGQQFTSAGGENSRSGRACDTGQQFIPARGERENVRTGRACDTAVQGCRERFAGYIASMDGEEPDF